MDIPICDRKKESCASDSICRSSVFILLREFFLFENGICVVDLFMGVANLKKFRRERFFFIWVVLPSRCLARSVFVICVSQRFLHFRNKL